MWVLRLTDDRESRQTGTQGRQADKQKCTQESHTDAETERAPDRLNDRVAR